MKSKIITVSEFFKNNKSLSCTIPIEEIKFSKFKEAFANYQLKIDPNNTEEANKSVLSKFLEFFTDYKLLVDRDDIDLSICNSNNDLKVIIETKKNLSPDMIKDDNFNKKSFAQVIYYYLNQKSTNREMSITSIIITDFYSIYLFKERDIHKFINDHKKIEQLYKNKKSDKELFYKDLIELLKGIDDELEAVKADLLDDSDRSLKELYRLLDIYSLFNLGSPNDSNKLNKKFYDELLYILGLQEKDNKLSKSEVSNSLIDLTDKMFKSNRKEESFDDALALNILWLNRILFLKILESQIQVFKNDDKFQILNPDKIKRYDQLNKLFFDILSTPRDKRNPDDKELHDDTPYLNSSLFDRSELEMNYGDITNLSLDYEISIKQGSVLYEDTTYKDTKLSLLEYLLRFLHCYKFNSDNSSVDSHTVIKSSVLGLVFEKLNGYKDGSFFTPSSITMYMSRRSIQHQVISKFNKVFNIDCDKFDELVKYATNNIYKDDDSKKAEEILESITIIDPAVGSGHFLVSSLNELIYIRAKLGLIAGIKIDIDNDELVIEYANGKPVIYSMLDDSHVITSAQKEIQRKIFNIKRGIIENQLYGMDINSNSVNICRLRLWIELLKHTYYIDDDYIDLEILPNLEFKIVTVDTLIKNEGHLGLFAETGLKSLKETVSKYFKASYENKQRVKDDIKNIIEEINESIEDFKGYDPFNSMVKAPFFLPEVMFGRDHFDIVIMNPPYIQLQTLAKGITDKYAKNKKNENGYDTFKPTGDIYQLFIERSFDFINNDSVVMAIISNKWMRAGYGESTRKFLFNNAEVKEVLDLSSSWFESATVDTNIILFRKEIKDSTTLLDEQSIYAMNISDKTIPIEESKINNKSMRILANNTGDPWVILDTVEIDILTKVKAQGKPLKDWDITINRGVLTGFNEAFIIDGKTKDELIKEDAKSSEIIKPLLRGRDIKRYLYDFDDKWLIATLPALNINIDEYPAIKNYLETFMPRIDQTGETGCRKKTNNEWFETQDTITYYEDFEKPKTVWTPVNGIYSFTYIENNMYFNNSIFMITCDNKNILKYLCAVLNVVTVQLGSLLTPLTDVGSYAYGSKDFMTTIPIPIPTEEQEEKVVSLVNIILEKKVNKEDTTEEEEQIDNIVYSLYNFTDEEIKFIKEVK